MRAGAVMRSCYEGRNKKIIRLAASGVLFALGLNTWIKPWGWAIIRCCFMFRLILLRATMCFGAPLRTLCAAERLMKTCL